MALTIENTINLTAYAKNPAPKVVSQLSIIHESSDGELVQYYIQPINQTQGDKNTYAIGVFDKDSRTYSYHDYPEVEWNTPGQRICGNRIERLGVKAFPAIGAIAFYKLMHRKITRIVAPVNRKDKRQKEPALEAVVNPDGSVTFTIIPPDKPEYACYRIVMQNDIYIEEYVTYDLVFTAPAPHISGEYRCYAVGYGEENDAGKYALSSIVYCAHCGDVFQRTHWNVHGRKKIVWRCISRLHKKTATVDCPARTVTEADLHAGVVQAVNEVCAKQELLLPQLKANIAKALGDDNSGPVAKLDAKIAELEQEILKRTRARQDCDGLGKEVLRLREEKYQLQLEDATKESLRQKITELEMVIAENGGKAEEYDDALVRKLIERITVHDDRFTVEFKSGIEIDVQL